MLRISDQITPAEAYQSTSLPVNQFSSQPITKSRLALRFGNPSISFELFQNQPNPFTQKTVITFQLPVASTAVLTILDNNGKVLWTKTGDYTAGLNTLDIDLTGLSGAGVLYYKLETPQQSAMRKMVRI